MADVTDAWQISRPQKTYGKRAYTGKIMAVDPFQQVESSVSHSEKETNPKLKSFEKLIKGKEKKSKPPADIPTDTRPLLRRPKRDKQQESESLIVKRKRESEDEEEIDLTKKRKHAQEQTPSNKTQDLSQTRSKTPIAEKTPTPSKPRWVPAKVQAPKKTHAGEKAPVKTLAGQVKAVETEATKKAQEEKQHSQHAQRHNSNDSFLTLPSPPPSAPLPVFESLSPISAPIIPKMRRGKGALVFTPPTSSVSGGSTGSTGQNPPSLLPSGGLNNPPSLLTALTKTKKQAPSLLGARTESTDISPAFLERLRAVSQLFSKKDQEQLDMYGSFTQLEKLIGRSIDQISASSDERNYGVLKELLALHQGFQAWGLRLLKVLKNQRTIASNLRKVDQRMALRIQRGLLYFLRAQSQTSKTAENESENEMEESVQIDEILPLDIEEQLQATTPSPTPHTTTTTRTMATLGTPSVEREMRSNKKQTEMRDRDEKQQLNTPHNPAVEKKKETSMNKRDACVSSKQPSVSSTPTEPNRTTDKVKGTPIAFLPRIGANHWDVELVPIYSLQDMPS